MWADGKGRMLRLENGVFKQPEKLLGAFLYVSTD